MIIKILLFPVILLLVLYFIIAQVVPTAKSISAQKALIAQEQEKLQAAQARLQKVQDFQNNIDAHPDEMAYVNDFVPNDQKQELLLSDIAQLAEQSGINLFSVGFSDSERSVSSANDNAERVIEAKLIVNGTYENFKAFADRLFRMRRLYAFKTFDITKGEQRTVNVEGGENENAQGLVLSGVISFAYHYIPGKAQLPPSSIGKPINYDLIDTVMQATAQTNPLVPQPNNRPNPFLP